MKHSKNPAPEAPEATDALGPARCQPLSALQDLLQSAHTGEGDSVGAGAEGTARATQITGAANNNGAVLGLLTDIDDTLTCDGAIEPQALAALHALQAAGLPVIAITGRPSGWSEHFAMTWPVQAIVAENGAVALRREQGRLRVDFVQPPDLRARNALRLQAVAQRILREVSGSCLAQDSAGRLTDIAVDHAEFAQLAPAAVAQVVALMRSEGMTATVSSIHINGWFGEHNKWSGACWIVPQLLGRQLEPEVNRWVYVGDSPNDQLMFQRFELSVGVANVLTHAAQMQHWPRYLTPGERGTGFAQLAQVLLRSL